ncbi:hypothetical protein L798_13251 [Zootermopsis nevadensis]|uniref:Uncharacterized protein n=1 Tax=Zootermopsis nevadensis TaxID=136037 RepID=A0A067QSI7_ZOONE|nr:hypothetical protein L798_13251 [Zootermopsis nevadensis]
MELHTSQVDQKADDTEVVVSEPSKKVRVTFFESEKPLIVSSPEPSDLTDDLDASGIIAAMTTSGPDADHTPPYARQTRVHHLFFCVRPSDKNTDRCSRTMLSRMFESETKDITGRC